MRRIGIDVGGTNTDAVLIEDGKVVRAVKAATTRSPSRRTASVLVPPTSMPTRFIGTPT